jgi:hypothetical protein
VETLILVALDPLDPSSLEDALFLDIAFEIQVAGQHIPDQMEVAGRHVGMRQTLPRFVIRKSRVEILKEVAVGGQQDHERVLDSQIRCLVLGVREHRQPKLANICEDFSLPQLAAIRRTKVNESHKVCADSAYSGMTRSGRSMDPITLADPLVTGGAMTFGDLLDQNSHRSRNVSTASSRASDGMSHRNAHPTMRRTLSLPLA